MNVKLKLYENLGLWIRQTFVDHGHDATTVRDERLREDIGAERVLLFGSRARQAPAYDSDYDIVVIAQSFENLNPLDRSGGLREVFYEVGGDAPMDLICLTPEEFARATRSISLIAAVLPEAIDLLPTQTAAR